jgi:butyryl-CoA dehydrogenase
MPLHFTEEQIDIQELCREIAEKEIKPVRAELDEKEEFPRECLNKLAEADLMGVYIPEEYGGLGGGCLELSIAMEEISRVCSAVGVSFAANALGSYPIILHGSEEQKRKYLPDVASGKKLVAFALTEPDAGSDAGGVKTTAVRDGDHYILNGRKQWITNGGEADIYTVIAITNKEKGSRGASAFIVEKGTPGFEFGKKEKKLGIRSSITMELIFEDCRIPVENLIGKEGRGFMITMKTLDHSRPGVGAQALGIAQGALDEAVPYARERRQFGHPIISFQAVSHMLADMATSIEAARGLVYRAARATDAEAPDAQKLASMAKVFASDVAMKVTTDAVQVLGGYGYMREYPVEKMMRDAKITQIYEGTNQIQRNVIATNLIKEDSKKKR